MSKYENEIWFVCGMIAMAVLIGVSHWENKDKMVHEYKVTVTRISNASAEIRIISPIELTEADVKSVAIEKAANHVFSEKDAEYEVQHIQGKLKQ